VKFQNLEGFNTFIITLISSGHYKNYCADKVCVCLCMRACVIAGNGTCV